VDCTVAFGELNGVKRIGRAFSPWVDWDLLSWGFPPQKRRPVFGAPVLGTPVAPQAGMTRTFGPLGFCGCGFGLATPELGRREKQIPEEMTDKKSRGKGKSNDGLAFVVSHPCRDEIASRIGDRSCGVAFGELNDVEQFR